jgi:hypothetical protein
LTTQLSSRSSNFYAHKSCFHVVLFYPLFNRIRDGVLSNHDKCWLVTNCHGVLQIILVVHHLQLAVVSQQPIKCSNTPYLQLSLKIM